MNNPALWWTLVGVLLMISEFVIPGVILFFFGLGALLTALISWINPELSISWQLALFTLFSLISLFSLRRLLKPIFTGTKHGHNETVSEGLSGEEGVVTCAIAPGAPGKIMLHGTAWKAESEEQIEEGKTVKVVNQRSLTVIVKQK
jgi:membrane protein implicated in regulation of membrane protease activity